MVAFAVFVPELCSLRGTRAEKDSFLFWKIKILILRVDEDVVLLPLWNNGELAVSGWPPATLSMSIFHTGRKGDFVVVDGTSCRLVFLINACEWETQLCKHSLLKQVECEDVST